MSKKVVRLFIKNNIIQKEDVEIYAYSFEILIATVMNFVVIIALAIITKSFVATILYLLGFVPLRAISGGFHAKTHFRCLIILIISYLMFILINKTINSNFVISATYISLVVSFLFVFFLSPVEDKNRPFTDEEREKFKKTSRLSIMAYAAVIIIFTILLNANTNILSLSLGILSASLSLLASKIKTIIVRLNGVNAVLINKGVKENEKR